MEKFVDSYNLSIVLEDMDGLQWVENHNGISLSDFETIYGNNSYNIVSIKMHLVK